MDNILSELREMSMVAEERDNMRTRLEGWLTEEGYDITIKEDPNTYFHISATHPKHKPFTILHPTVRKDSILLLLTLNFPKPTESIKKLSKKETQELVWSLCYSLLSMNIQFGFIPDICGQLA